MEIFGQKHKLYSFGYPDAGTVFDHFESINGSFATFAGKVRPQNVGNSTLRPQSWSINQSIAELLWSPSTQFNVSLKQFWAFFSQNSWAKLKLKGIFLNFSNSFLTAIRNQKIILNEKNLQNWLQISFLIS